MIICEKEAFITSCMITPGILAHIRFVSFSLTSIHDFEWLYTVYKLPNVGSWYLIMVITMVFSSLQVDRKRRMGLLL